MVEFQDVDRGSEIEGKIDPDTSFFKIITVQRGGVCRREVAACEGSY